MKTILFGKRLNIKLYTNKFIHPDTGIPVTRGRARFGKIDFGGGTEKEAYYNLIEFLANFLATKSKIV